MQHFSMVKQIKREYNHGKRCRKGEKIMLWKLSLKNIQKSFKDCAIYFITLVLGVAIFYMFNSLESQQAMLQVSQSTRDMIILLVRMLELISVFIAFILGLLIVYANNFLINRRKQEFGIYMTLGMGKAQISKILWLETVLIGILSLVVGLLIGVFASQFMSILVGKLFEADMSKFTFVFSENACIKTCIYFAIMYIVVMLFNTITISRYKLITLLTAIKKNQTIQMKNPVICIIVFLIASILLGYAYYKVTIGANTLTTADKIFPILVMGIIGTILVFWSISGLILKLVQMRPNTYLKDMNVFILRQLHNKINTTIASMSVICLMLFMTITILSSSISMRNTMQKDLIEMTPVDLNLYKTANLPNNGEYTQKQIEDSYKSMQETLQNHGFDMNLLKDTIEVTIYTSKELTWKISLASIYDEVKQLFPMLQYDTAESIMRVSDYNQVATLYHNPTYTLADDEYIVLCDFDNMVELRNQVLEKGDTISLLGKEYKPKYKECQSGFVTMSTSHVNTGIILVPDNCPLTEEMKEQTFLIANYNANIEEEKEKIESMFTDKNSPLLQSLYEEGIEIEGLTKNTIISASVGIATIVVFIAIYLGIIFLIASAAILALKQLTEASDNQQRYRILRKIGADEKMIHKALFTQIGLFFLFPLILAIIHSIFGIQFLIYLMSVLAGAEELLPSIIVTAIVIGGIYGIYFLATYIGSKNIIKENM